MARNLPILLNKYKGCWWVDKLKSQGITREGQRFWNIHDDVIKWNHFPCYWPFAQRIHQSPVNSLHKGQWRRALMFSLICVSINDWVNNHEAGDLRRYHAHYDVTVMLHGIMRDLFCHMIYRPVWGVAVILYKYFCNPYQRHFAHFLWNCPQVNAMGCHRWLVSVVSNNGLVP